MDPLVALFTLYPVLAIDICILTIVYVNLLAEIAVLIVFVSIRTIVAKPKEFSFFKFPARPEVIFVAIALIPTHPIGADSKPSLGF